MNREKLEKRLKNQAELLSSATVANNLMNRGRGCGGANSYQKELSLNPAAFLGARLHRPAEIAWLDVACGEGRALIEAAELLAAAPGERPARWHITGLDLAGMFRRIPAALENLELLETSVEDFVPRRRFDLITCVHGLHYVGDKLGALRRGASWLKKDGLLLASLDPGNLKLRGKPGAARTFAGFLRRAGFHFDGKKRLVKLEGGRNIALPFRYLGADDDAGPNYTGQPVVDSFYELVSAA